MKALSERIEEQYSVLGVGPGGGFVGKKKFKQRLIDLYPGETADISFAVNRMKIPDMPPKHPKHPKAYTQENSQMVQVNISSKASISTTQTKATAVPEATKNTGPQPIHSGWGAETNIGSGDLAWDNSVPAIAAKKGAIFPTKPSTAQNIAGETSGLTRLYFRCVLHRLGIFGYSPVGLGPARLSHYFMDLQVWNNREMYGCIWATPGILEFFVDSASIGAVVEKIEINTPFQYLTNWDPLDPLSYGYFPHEEALAKLNVVDRMVELCHKNIAMVDRKKKAIYQYITKWVGQFHSSDEFNKLLANKHSYSVGGVKLGDEAGRVEPDWVTPADFRAGVAQNPLKGSSFDIRNSVTSTIVPPGKHPVNHKARAAPPHVIKPHSAFEQHQPEGPTPKNTPLPQRRNAKVAVVLDHASDNGEESQELGPTLQEQSALLNLGSLHESDNSSEIANSDIKNAVLFSADVLDDPGKRKLLPQYGLMGEVFSSSTEPVSDPRLFLNTSHPWSFFICGLQGSGKSHSLSCLLENCLLPTRTLGILKRPLSGVVFHFSQYTSRLNFRPCEAAFIACPDPIFGSQHRSVPVTVLVSPSNFLGLEAAYSQIPGVEVKPLLLRPQDLNIGSMLTLMSVDQSAAAPLYISHVTKVLREMAASSSEFNYLGFKESLAKVKMLPLQRRPLDQRLELLESFLDLEGTTNAFDFQEGSITIVDLSCPFVDESTACVLFNICLGVFLQDSTPGAGKVVAVDEAHKYITSNPASKVLTESLLQLIRQQRHYGARIIISTQEPTIDPRLMDLCSATLIHRFTSPDWFNVLKKHVSILEDNGNDSELFRRIVDLRVGEGLLFAPSAIVTTATVPRGETQTEESGLWGEVEGNKRAGGRFEKLGSRFLKAKIRKRLTADGGKSIVCV